MNARSCPACHSIGAPRLIKSDGIGVYKCPHAWHRQQPTIAAASGETDGGGHR